VENRSFAFVALGANLGDATENVLRGFERLQQLSAGPLVRSSLWRSTPVDCPQDSPDFINAVAGLLPDSGETALSLLAKLQGIEMEFGRKPKTVLNEPRPLDLDLLTFGTQVFSKPNLTLPHPRAHLRRFVLAPLAEIAPELVLPNQQRSVKELLASLSPGEHVEKVSS
jgi:2-amino-4-hydroxy-6-hydroxymethyldihydropteridine diphosphokinase